MATELKDTKKNISRSILLGAAFLMATSSIGPVFITQTTVFTQQLAASFAFVLLISFLLDIVVQVNIWRIIAVSGLRVQEIANKVVPGLGILLTILLIVAGLAFNIGNVAGAGIGLNAMLSLDPIKGSMISATFAIFIFVVKETGKLMDNVAKIVGVVMIILMIIVAFSTSPPVGEAVIHTFVPSEISIFAIITLVGGTVGGYITFAGGHRLLDAGVKGMEALPDVTKSSVTGIVITGIMRIALFLAVLGVVKQGLAIDPTNPSASVFMLAAGEIGNKIFGIIMWAASITSIVGAAYASVSFLRSFHPIIDKYQKWITILFILMSTITFGLVGQPVHVLILVGALNALILPLALGTLLVGAYKKDIIGEYKHPLWLTITGGLVVIIMGVFGITTLIEQMPLLFYMY
ncbi:NRAMP family divalent metal transporter [Bacillus sp. FJAT-22090]|uniref:NRAMP family divalent metal transporter n=1 Tax=Bacillus sp. FJAT-22090 TaxID=1581038 RepID=UPI0011A080B8|nr:NRAMP family divalent metal transporter [Bacillus sp. FJAT-22090]